MRDLISCIIPTHNRAHTLKRAIDSVLAQTDQNFELIVVDDGSSDSTAELLKSYDDPKLKTIFQDNAGVSAARNRGVEQACGEWFAFLDSDDEWLPQKLTLQRLTLEENPKALWIHGEELWVRNGKWVNPKKIHQKSGGDIFERSLKLCLVSPSAVMIKRELYEQKGGFDENFVVCEDYDLWLRISKDHEVAFVSEPVLVKYGGHDDQLSARYKAMDYWRVLSMLQLLEGEELEREREVQVYEELCRKARILLTGYKKHNRERDCKVIEDMVKRANKYQ